MFTKRTLGFEAGNPEEARAFDIYTIHFDLHEQATSTNPKARIREAEIDIKIPRESPENMAIQYLDRYLVRKYGAGLLVYYEIEKINGVAFINSQLDEFITGSMR